MNTDTPLSFSSRITYSIILITSFCWCSSIILAPMLIDKGGFASKFAAGTYYFFSSYCHQAEARSFHLFGHQLAVCSRCTSIYFSFLLGVIAYPFFHRLNNITLPKIFPLIIAGCLLAADAVLDIMGIMNNTFLTRTVTGGFLGLLLPFYLIPGFVKVTGDIESALRKNKTKKICSQTD